jgi:hypothetical protein
MLAVVMFGRLPKLLGWFLLAAYALFLYTGLGN